MNRILSLQYSPVGTPNAASPINFEEAVSRRATPGPEQSTEAIKSALECIGQVRDLLSKDKVLNGSIRVSDNSDRCDSIQECREKWTAEMQERIEALKTRTELIKGIQNPGVADLRVFDQQVSELQKAKSRMGNEASDLQLQVLSDRVNGAIERANQQLDRLKAGYGDVGAFGAVSIYAVSAFLSALEGAKFLDAELLTDLHENLSGLKKKLKEFRSLIKMEMGPISKNELERAVLMSRNFSEEEKQFRATGYKTEIERNKLVEGAPWVNFNLLKPEQKEAYLVEFERLLIETKAEYSKEILTILNNKLKVAELLYRPEKIVVKGGKNKQLTEEADAVIKLISKFQKQEQKKAYLVEFERRLNEAGVSDVQNLISKLGAVLEAKGKVVESDCGSPEAVNVYRSMREIESQYSKIKEKLADHELSAKKRDETNNQPKNLANQTIQRALQRQIPYDDPSDLLLSIENSREVVRNYLKQVDALAAKLGITLSVAE